MAGNKKEFFKTPRKMAARTPMVHKKADIIEESADDFIQETNSLENISNKLEVLGKINDDFLEIFKNIFGCEVQKNGKDYIFNFTNEQRELSFKLRQVGDEFYYSLILHKNINMPEILRNSDITFNKRLIARFMYEVYVGLINKM